MASIGIMGGTFNPIHLGHIEIAKAAYEQYHLDEVWFMPNHIPAYKSEDAIVSGEDRLEMVRLAIKDIPYFKASDLELKRDGNTYTIDTLKLLKKQYPQHVFYFIMGADSLFSFDKWREYQKIPSYATLLVAPRDEKSKNDIMLKVQEFNQSFNQECFYVINCKEIPCSSSAIRAYFRVNDAISVHNFEKEELYLSERVFQYIVNKQLYN